MYRQAHIHLDNEAINRLNTKTLKTKEEITKIIQSDSLIVKHLYGHHWTSGSSTTVYPITVWENDITVQLATRKNVFNKCIERIVKASEGLLSDGFFSKGDGSCPATLRFYFKN